MYHMHTFVASNCMHMVHNGGFGFGGGFGYTYLNPLNPNFCRFELFIVKGHLPTTKCHGAIARCHGPNKAIGSKELH